MAKVSLSECLSFSGIDSKPDFMKIVFPIGVAVKSTLPRPGNMRPDHTCAKSSGQTTAGTVNSTWEQSHL